MGCRIFFLVFLVLVSLGIVSSGAEIKANFSIGGCDSPEGGVAVGGCSRDGGYYCDQGMLLYNTLIDGRCAFNSSSFVLGDPQCCPAGYLCNGTSFVCDRRIVDCYGFSFEGDCKSAGCYWMGNETGCLYSPQAYSCSVYEDKNSCVSDVWNLGRTGLGTEVCGEFFYGDEYAVLPSSCGCQWNMAFSRCELGYNVSSHIYGDVVDKFECLKYFDIDPCVNESQFIGWDTSFSILSGFASGLPVGLSQEICESGNITRICGEPIVLLPGFSSFAFVLVILVLTLYYFKKR